VPRQTIAQFFGNKDMDYLSLIKGSLLLLTNPNDVDPVYDIEAGLLTSRAMDLAVVHARTNPAIAALMDERYNPPLPTLETLLQYPPGSLGYCYARYLTDMGFAADFYRETPIADDATYLLMRMRKTHDIWHLVTGFSTDVVGEITLKAFEFAQTRRPLAIVLITGSLLKALVQAPESLNHILTQLCRAYQLGQRCQPLLAQRWEMAWEKPLHEWQRELGLNETEAIAPVG